MLGYKTEQFIKYTLGCFTNKRCKSSSYVRDFGHFKLICIFNYFVVVSLYFAVLVCVFLNRISLWHGSWQSSPLSFFIYEYFSVFTFFLLLLSLRCFCVLLCNAKITSIWIKMNAFVQFYIVEQDTFGGICWRVHSNKHRIQSELLTGF